jgi:hypothetical protein
MGPRDGAGEMVRAWGVRVTPLHPLLLFAGGVARFPSPLAGEGLGVRGPRRQARDAEAPCGADPSSGAFSDTFSRKGKRGLTKA